MAILRQCVAMVTVACMIASCGGRAANPVMVSQYGDHKKSCKALQMEMANTQGEITNLIPQTEKTGKNVALGIAGAFIIVPWFFMDLSQSEQMEVNALRQRYNNLAIIATDKNCDYDVTPIPEFTTKKASNKDKEKAFPSGQRR